MFSSKMHNEKGLTLIETMIAMLILMVALVSLAQVFGVAMVMNKNYGRDASKTTTYAHDKMEELTGLLFTDTTTDVSVNPPYPASGTGLAVGGSIPPAAPVALYSDYLDWNGARTTAANAVFTRQWAVSSESATLKKITVAVTSNKSFNFGTAPVTMAVTFKTP